MQIAEYRAPAVIGGAAVRGGRRVYGRVEGEVENEPAPGEKLVQKITYLKVTANGLTYGFMNGMRPRGMLLFEGTLAGSELSGRMRFGGINFTYPDGMTPPEIKFAFKKTG